MGVDGQRPQGWLAARQQLRLHLPGDVEVALQRVDGGFFRAQMLAERVEQFVVVPGFQDEVARAAPHRLHGEFDGAPRGHDNDRRRVRQLLEPRQHVESLLPGGGVARVVEVHEDQVRPVGQGRFEQGFGMVHANRLVAFALQEETKGGQHVGLVVGDEDASGRHAVAVSLLHFLRHCQMRCKWLGCNGMEVGCD